MKTDIQPVHLAITFRQEWLNDLMEPLSFKSTHLASRDKHYLWGYWGEYFHCKLQAINPGYIPDRKMDKKTWKGLYARLRYEEWCYKNYLEQNQELDEAECPNL